MLKELQMVELVRDLPLRGLRRGTHGTVVHCYRSGKAIEVEFFNDQGDTIIVATLSPGDVVSTNRSRTDVSPAKKSDKSGSHDKVQRANKKQGTSKASRTHKTRHEAEDNTDRQMLRDLGGNELTQQSHNGKIRSKDTLGRREGKPVRDRKP